MFIYSMYFRVHPPLVAQASAKKLRKLGGSTPPAGLAAWLHSAGGRQILILNISNINMVMNRYMMIT